MSVLGDARARGILPTWRESREAVLLGETTPIVSTVRVASPSWEAGQQELDSMLSDFAQHPSELYQARSFSGEPQTEKTQPSISWHTQVLANA
jgi:hypothetical protein